MDVEIPKGQTIRLICEGEHIGDMYYNGMSITITPRMSYGAHVSNRLNKRLELRESAAPDMIVASFYGRLD
jgi:hypothetical protein